MKLKATEKDVLAACLTYLNTLPMVQAWRQNSGAVISEYRGKKRMFRFGRAGK